MFFNERVEETFTKSLFCSFCNQVVVIQSLTCHVLFEDHFVEATRVARRFFYFCNFCDFFVFKEKQKFQKVLAINMKQ